MKLLHETIADIAYLAGAYGYYSGNSRADMHTFVHLAEEFEKQHKGIDWDDLPADYPDYMELVEDYTMKELGLKKKLMLNYPEAFTEPWDNLEVERVREDEDGTYPVHDEDDEEPNDFWSVYAHREEGGTMCVADVPTEKDANNLVEMITRAVKSYKDNGYLKMYDNKKLQEEINKEVDKLFHYLNPSSIMYTELGMFRDTINKLFI